MSDTDVRVFRLAEWPAPHSTNAAYLRARELRRLLAHRPGYFWHNLATIEVPGELAFLKARELVGFVSALFNGLPARLRAELGNDPLQLLHRLRDRDFRDRLAADELMYFYGECSSDVIGTPPLAHGGVDGERSQELVQEVSGTEGRTS